MAGDQYIVKRIGPTGDPDALDDGQTAAVQLPQEVVFVLSQPVGQFFDGVDVTGIVDEPHNVAGDTSGDVDESVAAPVGEGCAPFEIEKIGMAAANGEFETGWYS